MLWGRRGINGRCHEKRFCFDCGIADVNIGRGYSPGMEVWVDGERWVWCIDCREVKDGAATGWFSHGLGGEECKVCFERREEAARLRREELLLRYRELHPIVLVRFWRFVGVLNLSLWIVWGRLREFAWR